MKFRFKQTFYGWTIVETMIVLAIIGLLVAIAIPNFQKAHEQTIKNEIAASQPVIPSNAVAVLSSDFIQGNYVNYDAVILLVKSTGEKFLLISSNNGKTIVPLKN